jgi:hypothetical protein
MQKTMLFKLKLIHREMLFIKIFTGKELKYLKFMPVIKNKKFWEELIAFFSIHYVLSI